MARKTPDAEKCNLRSTGEMAPGTPEALSMQAYTGEAFGGDERERNKSLGCVLLESPSGTL
jgi:hypothetical protein